MINCLQFCFNFAFKFNMRRYNLDKKKPIASMDVYCMFRGHEVGRCGLTLSKSS